MEIDWSLGWGRVVRDSTGWRAEKRAVRHARESSRLQRNLLSVCPVQSPGTRTRLSRDVATPLLANIAALSLEAIF